MLAIDATGAIDERTASSLFLWVAPSVAGDFVIESFCPLDDFVSFVSPWRFDLVGDTLPAAFTCIFALIISVGIWVRYRDFFNILSNADTPSSEAGLNHLLCI